MTCSHLLLTSLELRLAAIHRVQSANSIHFVRMPRDETANDASGELPAFTHIVEPCRAGPFKGTICQRRFSTMQGLVVLDRSRVRCVKRMPSFLYLLFQIALLN